MYVCELICSYKGKQFFPVEIYDVTTGESLNSNTDDLSLCNMKNYWASSEIEEWAVYNDHIRIVV